MIKTNHFSRKSGTEQYYKQSCLNTKKVTKKITINLLVNVLKAHSNNSCFKHFLCKLNLISHYFQIIRNSANLFILHLNWKMFKTNKVNHNNKHWSSLYSLNNWPTNWTRQLLLSNYLSMHIQKMMTLIRYKIHFRLSFQTKIMNNYYTVKERMVILCHVAKINKAELV